MASEKTDAIIVRLVPWSETSCILNLLTSDFGLLAAVAKGARRPKGPFENSLDLLSTCRIVFIPKSSDALSILTEAKLTRRFKSGERELGRLYAGYYWAELIASCLEPGPSTPELFRLLQEGLLALDSGLPLVEAVLLFELQLLRWMGHLPSFHNCASCGGEVLDAGSKPFSIQAGGLVCEECRLGQRMVIRLHDESLAIMHAMSQPSWHFLEESLIPNQLRGEIRGCIQRYLSATLDRRFRLHDFLDDLAH